MSGSGKAGNGRGNNRRRPFRRRDRDNNPHGSSASQSSAGAQKNRGQVSGGEPRIKDAASSRTSAGVPEGESRAAGAASSQNPRFAGSENQGRQNRDSLSKRGGEYPRGEKAQFVERPKWIPPKMNTEPLPEHDCPWCGKPIRDISLAISDRDTGAPVHFECVAARIAGGEILEKGDVVTYIGGGRFGIVCFDGPGGSHMTGHDFKIKKVIEWENKEKRAEWRSVICEHYSVT